MPTYAYACTECDHRFEAQQSFTDPALTQCPRCQGRLRKLFSSVGIVFKGSGFYRTDSRAAAANGASNGKTDAAAKGKPDGAGKAQLDGASKGKAEKAASGSGSSGSGSSGSGGSGGSGSSSGSAA